MKWKEVTNSAPTEIQIPNTTKRSLRDALALSVKRDLTLAYTLSLIGAILMATISLSSLLYPSIFYPTGKLIQSFVPNDVANLFVGLPILLGSMWLTKQGKLVGLLCWPGALLYILYNYIAYIVGIPLSVLTFVYLVLILVSTCCLLNLLKNTDKKSVQERLSEAVPVRTASGVLILFGVLFTFRALGTIIEASTNQMTLPVSEISVLIADIAISIPLVTGGGLLLRRSALGYVSGLGLLFATSMLFIGLIMVLLLQPVLTNTPVFLADIIVVSLMGLISFIPLGLFVHKVVAS